MVAPKVWRPMKGGALKTWRLVLAALMVPMLVLVVIAVLVSAIVLGCTSCGRLTTP
jgi:hypothetical protein